VPLRRHPALHQLSHDHHHGLVAAHRLKKGQPIRADAVSIQSSISHFWDAELALHFALEEQYLFKGHNFPPALKELVANAIQDHAALRDLTSKATNGTLQTKDILRYAELLETHIRFEERIVFPDLQRYFSDAMLTDIGKEMSKERADSVAPCSMKNKVLPSYTSNK